MKVILVDFSWCCHRFYHAFDQLDENKRVCFGFTRLTESLLDQGFKVVFCMEAIYRGTPSEREVLLESYKEGRDHGREMYASTMKVISLLSLLSPRVSFVSVDSLEADDTMAILFFQFKSEGADVVIYTGDNDLLQLIPHGARVSRKIDSGSLTYVDETYIMDKYGVDSYHLILYRVLKGDSSDRIPPAVPRLNTEFLKLFVRKWRELGGFDKTLIALQEEHPEYCKRLREARPQIVRNVQLMDLGKYEKTFSTFQIENRIFEGAQSRARQVIEALQLYGYKRYLERCL